MKVSHNGGAATTIPTSKPFQATVPENLFQSQKMLYAASLDLDCGKASFFDVGPLTGNLTLNLINGSKGQRVTVTLRQDATGSRLLTHGTTVAVPTDLAASVLSTAASKEDVLSYEFHERTGKFRLVRFVKGF